MTDYVITPAVDAVREFLEIAGDFTNPLEVVREAISNSLDANATDISLEFTAPYEAGSPILQIIIRDNGDGMDKIQLQSFFDLGNSAKRGDPSSKEKRAMARRSISIAQESSWRQQRTDRHFTPKWSARSQLSMMASCRVQRSLKWWARPTSQAPR